MGTDSPNPIQVTGLSNVTSIAAGQGHNVALKSDGTVWTWGDNSYGQFGNISAPATDPTPVQASGISNVSMIGAVAADSYAVESNGTVWSWGYNNDGEVGNGFAGANVTTPVQLLTLGSGGAAIAPGRTATRTVTLRLPRGLHNGRYTLTGMPAARTVRLK